MKNLTKKHFYIIGAWFLINLLQAAFTGLHSDESYYWLYSRNLAWGFFDHPPMVALFIFPGQLLLAGELGVRLFFVLFSTFTFALILNELNEKEDLFFLTVFVLSFPLVHTHIAGFLAIPDIPLLFFTLLFLIFYRKFLIKPSLNLSFLLAFAAAAMIYSKYHAFIVIGLTVLSNIKLLKNKYFWITAVLTVLFLVPHALWQIQNEFPTFKYHLITRSKPVRLKHITDNILNQYAMAGPLTAYFVFLKLAGFKVKNSFDRALIFNIVGFYILFFLLSFKNRIEAHWISAVMPMIMIITYPLIKNDPKVKKWFLKLAVSSVVIIFLVRIYFILDVIPNVGHTKITFYKRKAYAMQIKELANGCKVGVYNNYAALSNYFFYTGDSAIQLSTPEYRFNQFDLWDIEGYADGEPIFGMQPNHLPMMKKHRMVNGQKKSYFFIQEFQSLKHVYIDMLNCEKRDDGYHFEISLHNKKNRPVLTEHISKPVLGLMQERTEIARFSLAALTGNKEIKPGEKIILNISVPESKLNGKRPVAIYTRTKESIRGEIISVKPE